MRFRIGLEYHRRGMPEAALEQLDHAVRIDPTHIPALLTASEIETRLGRADAALARAIRAIAREPANAEAHYRAGLAAEAGGRRAEARAFIDRAATLDPSKTQFRDALRRISGP